MRACLRAFLWRVCMCEPNACLHAGGHCLIMREVIESCKASLYQDSLEPEDIHSHSSTPLLSFVKFKVMLARWPGNLPGACVGFKMR